MIDKDSNEDDSNEDDSNEDDSNEDDFLESHEDEYGGNDSNERDSNEEDSNEEDSKDTKTDVKMQRTLLDQILRKNRKLEKDGPWNIQNLKIKFDCIFSIPDKVRSTIDNS